MSTIRARLVFALAAAAFPIPGFSAPETPPVVKDPPRSWIDPDTGHRVIRITDDPNTESLYFNYNCFTPDGKEMIFTTRGGGVSVLDLATWKNRPVVKGGARVIMVGHKTPRVFYIKSQENALYATDLDTGETQKLADMPEGGSVSAINADETIAAGTRVLGDNPERRGGAGRGNGMSGAGKSGSYQANDKMEMMERRLAEHLPNEIYLIDLGTGKRTTLIENTDWLNHLQFSPTDPGLLLYCHEGPWWKVDRIWTIRTDGTQNTLVQPRTMEMEASGHEFWSADGKKIYYDLQTPWGVVFWVAGYNIETKERTWYHIERSEWSIHFNATSDETLFCGDGADNPPGPWADASNRWIYLFVPDTVINGAPWKTMRWPYVTAPGETLVRPGVFHTEKLVHMVKHNYLLEPNPIFTPDKKYVIFRSDMFGDTYAFAAEVAKAAPAQ
jgi:oligogalacturonide lyase